MQIFKLIVGLLAIGLAWAFIFRTGLIFKINLWMKHHVFNDELALFSGRRLAVLLAILGTISLFSGIENISRDKKVDAAVPEAMFARAESEFKVGNYESVVTICSQILKLDKSRQSAWILLAHAYWALGDKEQARRAARALRRLDPTAADSIQDRWWQEISETHP